MNPIGWLFIGAFPFVILIGYMIMEKYHNPGEGP